MSNEMLDTVRALGGVPVIEDLRYLDFSDVVGYSYGTFGSF